MMSIMTLATQIWKNRVEEVITREQEVKDNIIAISHLKFCTPQLQNGPQCGLVALQMGISALQIDPVWSVESLFNLAKQLGCTVNGEMYSVENMANLCQMQPGCKAEVFEVNDCQSCLRRFLQGGPILIPYDNDKNFHPCLKKGHSAHWAVVLGFLLLTSDTVDIDNLTKDVEIDSLFHSATADIPVELKVLPECLYVYCLHGKSRHVAVWNYLDLLQSNRNLMEFGDDRSTDGRSYILPEGGVEAGLCGKAVQLMKLQ